MVIRAFVSLRRLSHSLPPKSTSSAIRLITLDEKFLGKRSAGNPHAAFVRWRELETWHGRDTVILTDERVR